jgi:ferric-dicitrate binding protein FerR (iron transport regulator)
MDERWQKLLAGYLDDELDEAERRELDAELQRNPELRAELEQFRKLKRVTDAVRYADLPDAVWETYWSSLYRKMERGLGWLLFSASAAILACYGVIQMLSTLYTDYRISWIVKIGVTGLLFGLIVLVVSLIRERIFAYRNDRYREVIK